MYKGIIDAANGILKWIKNNISGIKGFVMGALSGIAAYITTNLFAKLIASTRQLRAEAAATFDSSTAKIEKMYKAADKIKRIKMGE